MRPALLAATAAAGFDLVTVDPVAPLADQGPFDVLLHKIRTPDFTAQLAAYVRAHGPGLRLVDSPSAVARLQSRATMLDPLRAPGRGGSGPGLVLHPPSVRGASDDDDDDGDDGGGAGAAGPGQPPWPPPAVVVAAPTQVVLEGGGSEGRGGGGGLEALAAAGLRPPLLAKPLHAGGQPGAHALGLLTDLDAVAALAASGSGEDGSPPPLLPGLAPPLVLQPYVPHRPPLFKVFVLGPSVALARRPSLRVPPPPEDVTASVGGAHALARVSAYTSAVEEAGKRGRRAGGGGGSGGGGGGATTTSPDPPRWVLEALAAELRAALGLQVFNFDLIRVARDLMEEEAGPGADGGGRGGDADRHGASSRPPPPPPAPGPPGPCPPAAEFLVIDINYFPGIEKLPGYEGLMITFLEWVTGPDGTAATTGWEGEVFGGGAPAVAAAAAAVPAEGARTPGPPPLPAAPRPFPSRPSSGVAARLSMSLSQVPAPSGSIGADDAEEVASLAAP